MKAVQNKNRIWELDFLRGIALILMIYFHIIFDMKEFYNYPVIYGSGINYYIGKAAAILFILISGISCSLSRNNMKRGLKVLGIALVITAVSYIYSKDFCIKFGILHFLGASMLLYPLYSRINKYLLIVLGTAVIIAGYFVQKINVSTEILFPIGLINSKFTSGDYYPLLPWLGVFMYGNAMGRILYTAKTSILNFPIRDNIISMGGRKTLLIYVLHQPVIVLILALVNIIIAQT